MPVCPSRQASNPLCHRGRMEVRPTIPTEKAMSQQTAALAFRLTQQLIERDKLTLQGSNEQIAQQIADFINKLASHLERNTELGDINHLILPSLLLPLPTAPLSTVLPTHENQNQQ